MSSDPQRALVIEWLVRLRWFFLAGQVLALGVASWGFSVALQWLPISLALATYVGSNALLSALARRTEVSPSGVMGAVLTIDTALLTVLLGASGGAANPFTVLYLVNITLSAVVLSAAWTAAIAALSIAGFGILFLLAPAEA